MLTQHLTPCPNHSTLRHQEASDSVQFSVYDQGNIRWLGTADGAIQAAVNLDDPATPVLSYIRAMLSGLALTPRIERVLDLGYGGGTLARSIRANVPGARVTSIECNHTVVSIAHRWLGGVAPERVLMTRAETFLAQPQLPADAIFCDLHARDTAVNPITQQAFHDAAYRNLADNGVYVLNLLPRNTRDAVNLIKPVRARFAQMWISPVADCQNLIIFARKQPLSEMNLDAPYADCWRDALRTVH